MTESDKKVDELLQKIDNIPLVPKKELDNMDFYELCYYMQTLNMIDALDGDGIGEGEL